MKITSSSTRRSWSALIWAAETTLACWMGAIPAVHGQGRITFDQIQFGLPYQNYYEQDFRFQVVPGVPCDPPPVMGGMNFLGFNTSLGGWYVSLSLADGGTFGLSSVDLNGTYYNGTTVQFNGYFGDGSLVSTTFSVPYNFQWSTYQFGPQFSSGLVRVDIPNNPWAMDNLAYLNVVPEPGALSLLGLGAMALVASRYRQRQRPHVT